VAGSGQHNTATLTRAIARGDRDALAQFYNAWFDRSYAAARRLTGRDESFCLDVVQEAMLRVVRSIRPMASETELGAWMERVIRSAAVDLIRKESRREARERRSADGVQEVRSVAAAALAVEQTGWAMESLAQLPEADQTLLAERIGRSGSLRQAGDLAGVNGDAAHGRIRRAMARLRALAREVFDES
jgi:RNA polymerase sigma factor (sigma-70 family)